MRIVIGRSGLSSLKNFEKLTELLASRRASTELMRGVIDAGRKTKTPVQKAVFRQMGLKSGNYNSHVVAGTRGVPRKEILAYDIFGVKGGAKIEAYKGLRSVGRGNKLNVGRSGSDKGTVRSAVWNNPRIFKRSFEGNAGGFYAMRPASAGTSTRAPKALWTFGLKVAQPRGAGGRFESPNVQYGKTRRLFGPSLMKEIPEDQSLATFLAVGPINLEQAVMRRVTKLMRY
ncbi:hypothetical protein [Rhizobium sp. SSA_523]|uniref:hypothetical protein n=1 Tax=Rhizobium sp. SSA_523 TaxID=2952477 RepID=UPI002090D211|nr:hypothetical protein [Rhizobium sp. SSA_523]MCO5730093.1 hypothetical protein [Rhizobium sp. SSA_523]WKC25158.1 hypothetical protein QTJ18_14315 [Rhizobium sp. SSA_523]